MQGEEHGDAVLGERLVVIVWGVRDGGVGERVPADFGVEALEVGRAEEQADVEVEFLCFAHGECEGFDGESLAAMVGVDEDVLWAGDSELACADADGAVDDADVGDGVVVVFDDGAVEGVGSVPASAVDVEVFTFVGILDAEQIDESGVDLGRHLGFVDQAYVHGGRVSWGGGMVQCAVTFLRPHPDRPGSLRILRALR